MTLREFIRQNRMKIDTAINRAMYRHDGNGGRGIIPEPAPTYNDEERRLWIVNDEGLYLWARSEGANV